MVGKLVMSAGTSWSSRALVMHPAAKDLPVPMSPNSSSPMFRLNAWGQTGQTIQKYLRDIRLSEAKLLLRQCSLSLLPSYFGGFHRQRVAACHFSCASQGRLTESAPALMWCSCCYPSTFAGAVPS